MALKSKTKTVLLLLLILLQDTLQLVQQLIHGDLVVHVLQELN